MICGFSWYDIRFSLFKLLEGRGLKWARAILSDPRTFRSSIRIRLGHGPVHSSRCAHAGKSRLSSRERLCARQVGLPRRATTKGMERAANDLGYKYGGTHINQKVGVRRSPRGRRGAKNGTPGARLRRSPKRGWGLRQRGLPGAGSTDFRLDPKGCEGAQLRSLVTLDLDLNVEAGVRDFSICHCVYD